VTFDDGFTIAAHCNLYFRYTDMVQLIQAIEIFFQGDIDFLAFGYPGGVAPGQMVGRNI